MKSEEIRSRFLEFFKKRGHAIIPSASLVTTDEKGVTNATLFNTAGMQPLIPYLLGKPHPAGARLVDVQKCLRTVDIDDIGDKTHATFFEMLGNWSLGDYFKKEAINWSYEFLTSKDEGLGLNPNQLYVTVFEGDSNAARDDEAAEIWRGIFETNGVAGERIFFMPAVSNWWEAGDSGPCGPDTEMYYDVQNKFGGRGISKEEFLAADAARDVVEVWNDVFMQYEKKDGKIVGKLPKPSVDTGAGLERLAMTLQNVDNIYDTDLFKPVMEKIREASKNFDLKSARVVADHTRAAVFLIAEGVKPANTDRGYVLRRLIRRAVRFGKQLGLAEENYSQIINAVAEKYQEIYSLIRANKRIVEEEFLGEVGKFNATLDRGLKEFEKIVGIGKISGHDAFLLFTSYGFPLDLTVDLAKEKGLSVDKEEFEKEFKAHQDLSRAGAEQKFKGGLADHSETVTKLHTAHHLLLRALQKVLGDSVKQRGSNITAERLRIDFAHSKKMTPEEIAAVEKMVNEKIAEKLPVIKSMMPKAEAEKLNAEHEFGQTYPEIVSVYSIGPIGATAENPLFAEAFSVEFCGGPHVENSGGLGRFKILKEEAVSAGIRRIKAVLIQFF